ncbi:MAG: T9SS type A sorting domain-containing protein [Bacteroidota bacterium]
MKQLFFYCFTFQLAFHFAGQAQTIPDFQTTFYFEDAIGNRDSIIVGYDELASDCQDEDFGEITLTAPFDSTFEVRAAVYAPPVLCRSDLGKKVITKSGITWQNCPSMNTVIFYTHAKYWPVTVRWDSLVFSTDYCRSSSAILDHVTEEVAGPIPANQIPPYFACLSVQSAASFTLPRDTLLDDWSPVSIEKEVESLGMQTIYGLRFHYTFEGGYSPCFWVTTPTEHPITSSPDIQLFPNPTTGQVTITGLQGHAWQQLLVLDSQGRMLEQFAAPQEGLSLELRGRASGLYFLCFMDREGRKVVRKVVLHSTP